MKSVMEDLKGFDKIRYDLERSFDESCKDPSFIKLVKPLKVSKDVLMKYTSILEQSKIECNNCSKCKSIMECKNTVEGHYYYPRVENDGLIFEYKECKYKEEFDKENNYQKNVFTFHEPNEIKKADIKDIYLDDKNRFETIEWIHKFIKNYPKNKKQKGLYLNGNFGCGKTYILSAMLNELAKQGIRSAIIFWPEFLIDLKTSFQSDFKEKFEYIKKVPLLLIDDIGAENSTEWTRDDIFCPIVQYRMENELPTFFTSNLTLEELEKHFMNGNKEINPIKARRIIERIKQLTVSVKMVSKNLRK